MSLTAAAIGAFVRPLLLPAALIASLAVNALQWRDAAVTEGVTVAKHAGELTVAELRGRLAAQDRTIEQSAELVTLAATDAMALLERMRGLYADADTRLGRYRTAIAALPPAGCAPGAERQDAVNELLRIDAVPLLSPTTP